VATVLAPGPDPGARSGGSSLTADGTPCHPGEPLFGMGPATCVRRRAVQRFEAEDMACRTCTVHPGGLRLTGSGEADAACMRMGEEVPT
jgi:hypothetical protein